MITTKIINGIVYKSLKPVSIMKKLVIKTSNHIFDTLDEITTK